MCWQHRVGVRVCHLALIVIYLELLVRLLREGIVRFMIKESNSACLMAFMKLIILDIEAWPKSHVVINGTY